MPRRVLAGRPSVPSRPNAPATGEVQSIAGPALLATALVLAAAVYANTLTFGFVYDDVPQILENTLLHTGSSWTRFFVMNVWAHIAPAGGGTYYRPLFLVWLSANYHLFGYDPLGWHAGSIAFHVAVTGTVYALARRIGVHGPTAGVAALVFAVHPVHVESVAWISGVVDPMCALFLLVAALCHLRWRAAHGAVLGTAWCAAAVATYSLALLSKETAVAFPAAVVALEWLVIGRRDGAPAATRARHAIIAAMPYALAVAIYLVVRALVLGLVARDTGIAIPVALLTVPSVVLHYASQFLLPLGLSPEYGLEHVTRISDSAFLLPLAIVLVGGAGLVAACRHSAPAAFALTWAAVTIGPALLLWKLPPDSFVHDRYLYLPSVGLCVLAAMALGHVPSGRVVAFGGRAAAWFVTASAVGLLAAGTVAQCAQWRNDLALFSRAVQSAPSVSHVRTNYAIQLLEHGRLAEAQAAFEQVLRSDPDNWAATYGIGQVLARRGALRPALEHLERAVALRPSRAEQYIHLGYARLGVGDATGAEAAFREAIRRQPLGQGHRYALGVALQRQGRLHEALAAFEDELGVNPGQEDTLRRIEQLRARLGHAVGTAPPQR